MYDAQSGSGAAERFSAKLDQRDVQTAQPNLFYQEKVLQYLSGTQIDTFKKPERQVSAFDQTTKTELLKGMAESRYDDAIQMMLQNEMQTIQGMTADQMRQVCRDQVELLKQEGHELLKKDRFVDARRDIHQTLEPLYNPQQIPELTATRETPAAAVTNQPQTREQTVNPELQSQTDLKRFLEAQLILLNARLKGVDPYDTKNVLKFNSRISLAKNALVTISSGKPFSVQDSELLVYFIDETKKSESSRLERAQSRISNDAEIRDIASSVSQLWQMQQYVREHTEKPSV